MKPTRRPSSRIQQITDPLQASARDPLAGPSEAHFERGTILTTDAARHSYRVHLASGRTLSMNRVMSNPQDLSLWPHGTQVLVSFALGIPYIVGCLPLETPLPDDELPGTVTDTVGHGGADSMLDRNVGVSARSAGQPNDILPGDAVLQSSDGASIAALNGKVAQLRGGPLARVQAFGTKDTVQIISGLYRLLTWMGEAKYVNDDGKTSFIWRGGSDQLTQTGMDEERYTIRLDAGHSGDVLKLEITNPDGQPVFRFHVNPEGACELFSAGGINQHSGSANSQVHPVRYHGRLEEVIEGARTTRVSSDVTETIEGKFTQSTEGGIQLNTARDYVRNINRDERSNITGNDEIRVGGSYKLSVFGGDLKNEVALTNSMKFSTNAGDITFDSSAGKFIIKLSGNDRIELGDNAAFHAVRFEELKTLIETLQRDLNDFKSTFELHNHTITGTAGLTTISGTAIPTTSRATRTNLNTTPMKSPLIKVA